MSPTSFIRRGRLIVAQVALLFACGCSLEPEKSCSREPDLHRALILTLPDSVAVQNVPIIVDSNAEYCKFMIRTSAFDRMLATLDPTNVIAGRASVYNLYLYTTGSVATTSTIAAEDVVGLTVYYLNFEDESLRVRTYVRSSTRPGLDPILALDSDVDGWTTNCIESIRASVLPIHGFTGRSVLHIYHTDAVTKVEQDIDRFKHLNYGVSNEFTRHIERYIESKTGTTPR
ncbi:MAG: hypothetical protein JSS89_08135 [Bacteroidetes bacterium]|nr:hypothetical protein [Bacteroidota bacterium]